MAADRGRSRRVSTGHLEAIAILLAGLDARGKDSLVARRIRSTQEAGQDKDEDAVPSLAWAQVLAAR